MQTPQLQLAKVVPSFLTVWPVQMSQLALPVRLATKSTPLLDSASFSLAPLPTVIPA